MFKIIKTRLEKAKGIWLDELPRVLWAYKTMAQMPTGETLFRLTFGNEVVIPAEMGLASYRISHHNKGRNKEGICLQLGLLGEVKAIAE